MHPTACSMSSSDTDNTSDDLDRDNYLLYTSRRLSLDKDSPHQDKTSHRKPSHPSGMMSSPSTVLSQVSLVDNDGRHNPGYATSQSFTASGSESPDYGINADKNGLGPPMSDAQSREIARKLHASAVTRESPGHVDTRNKGNNNAEANEENIGHEPQNGHGTSNAIRLSFAAEETAGNDRRADIVRFDEDGLEISDNNHHALSNKTSSNQANVTAPSPSRDSLPLPGKTDNMEGGFVTREEVADRGDHEPINVTRDHDRPRTSDPKRRRDSETERQRAVDFDIPMNGVHDRPRTSGHESFNRRQELPQLPMRPATAKPLPRLQSLQPPKRKTVLMDEWHRQPYMRLQHQHHQRMSPRDERYVHHETNNCRERVDYVDETEYGPVIKEVRYFYHQNNTSPHEQRYDYPAHEEEAPRASRSSKTKASGGPGQKKHKRRRKSQEEGMYLRDVSSPSQSCMSQSATSSQQRNTETHTDRHKYR